METNSTGEISYKGSTDYTDVTIHRPQLIAEKVLKQPSLCCSITIPVQQYNANSQYTESITTTFPFYMSDDFGFGITSEYKPLVDPDSAFSTLNSLISHSSAVLDNTQVSLQSRPMSALMWKGSKFDGFNLNCIFVCTNRLINPANIIKTLAATVLPTTLNTGDRSLGTVGNAVALGRAGLATLWDIATEASMGVVSSISNTVKTVFNNTNIGDKFNTVKNDVGNLWTQAKDSVENSKVGQAVSNNQYAENAANVTKNYGNQLQDAYKEAAATDWKSAIDENNKKIHNIIMSAGIVAPLHYGLKFTGTDSGSPTTNSVGVQAKQHTCVKLNIGEWFEADDLVVTNLSNVKFSKEIVAPATMTRKQDNDLYHGGPTSNDYGFPLYATCTLHLSPIAMMDYETFGKYFKNTSARNMYNQVEAYAEL